MARPRVETPANSVAVTHIVVYNVMCGGLAMATNLAIDDSLLNLALRIGGMRTKKDTVTLALEEFIQRRRAEEVISLFGKVEYDKEYDYKKLRKRA